MALNEGYEDVDDDCFLPDYFCMLYARGRTASSTEFVLPPWVFELSAGQGANQGLFCEEE